MRNLNLLSVIVISLLFLVGCEKEEDKRYGYATLYWHGYIGCNGGELAWVYSLYVDGEYAHRPVSCNNIEPLCNDINDAILDLELEVGMHTAQVMKSVGGWEPSVPYGQLKTFTVEDNGCVIVRLD